MRTLREAFGASKSFATHAVTVAIEMTTVTRLAYPHRRRTLSTCVRAVSEIRLAAQGPMGLTGSRRCRAAAVAVVIPGLAIVVTAFGIESAAVRCRRHADWQKQQWDKQQDAHNTPQLARFGSEMIEPGVPEVNSAPPPRAGSPAEFVEAQRSTAGPRAFAEPRPAARTKRRVPDPTSQLDVTTPPGQRRSSMLAIRPKGSNGV